ncbi:MAG: efflux RND transporter periplasmic adaptor subunit [Roseiarcus sp.]|uniref:efflux RND transporter periplasmic adaptor subunit n=1 Tax=Roseiarcus sp. TaxID=1969460 RepID=UPI003C5DFA9C
MKSLAPLAALGAALLVSACDQKTEASRAAPTRPVLVAEAHYAPREQAQVLAGVVKARIESDLAFRIAGKMATRLVDMGALVHKGDALAELDDADFRLQLEEAQAEQSSAVAALVQAEAEERRLTTLSKQGWTANADFDKARSAADQARAAVTRADRAVSLARNAIEYATLRADADGVISAVSAEAGQVVAVGAPIVRLAHADEREAAVSVPETLVDRARSDSARVEFWALPGVSVNARLRELSPTSDAATRTYPARFTLVDAPAGVRLGMSVTVSLEADSAKVARMPISALFDIGQGPSVWVVDPVSSTLSAAHVVLAGYDAEWAFIGAGVPEGAKVVALGVHKLDQGEKVRVVDSLAGL